MKTMFSQWPKMAAKTAGCCVLVAGAVVLTGWCFDVSLLKSILPDWPKMSPLTAVSFALGGLSLWCVASAAQRKTDLSRVSQICAAIIFFVGLFRLGDYLFGWNLNFDTLGFREPTGIVSPARMSSATALNFLLLGGALLLAGSSRLIRTFQFLTLSAVLFSWLGFSHFLFGDAPIPFFSAMAMHTAVCFLLLGAGIFCTRADGGLMTLLVSDTAGGLFARRLFPSVLFVVFALNWLESWIERHNWFSSGAESSLFLLNDIIIFGAIVWFNAALLHRTDMKRGRTEEARSQLAGIVESSDDAIIGKTLDGIITSWNHGAEKIFGYSAQEAIGQPMLMLFPPERVDEERDILTRIARGENVENFETVRIRKDKKQIHVSATISPLKDSSDKIVGASKIAHDITARKEAEEARRVSEARLNFALQTGHIGAWELSMQDHIANRTLLHDHIFGYDTLLPLWTYEMFLEHVLPEDRVKVDWSFREATAARGNWNFECRIRRADGETRWIWAAGGHELDSKGKAVRMSGIVQDITERKAAEAEIQNQLHELQRWHETMMGREERVLELKHEVNELLTQQHQPVRYSDTAMP
jgi:PAS domain S-box-containing protein